MSKTEPMNTYMKNLLGGSDAFQENELQQLLMHDHNKVKKKEKTGNQKFENNLKYHTCKKLILNVDLVVKNFKGEVIVKEPLNNIKQIFSKDNENFESINQVVDELTQKIKHILVQRGSLKEEDNPEIKKVKKQS